MTTNITQVLSDLVAAVSDLHPVYGNTAVCWGGIGGQTITEHCAYLCENPKHDAARAKYESAIAAAYEVLAKIEREN